MASFDIIKTIVGPSKRPGGDQIANLLIGALAGTIALTFTYPTDLLRRKMQLSGTPGHTQYNNMFEAAYKIFNNDGIPGLYKGYYAALLKVVPSVAILFWCNELLK